MAPALEVEGLRKSYGDVEALKGVDLRVEEGQLFGLLGPNGAGKTTFIHILVGLVKRSGGEARVCGHDVEGEYRTVRNLVGLAPQEFDVDRFFPIREVLAHKAGYHGMGRAEARSRADEVLRKVGIFEKRDVRFPWLSGGMKRRLLIARALVTNPRLLILDEPTAGVDVQLRRDLWDLVRELNDGGTTVLLTTHYIEEAETLCEEVAILHRGNLLERASPRSLTERYVDTLRLTVRPAGDDLPPLEDDRIVSVERDGEVLEIQAHGGARVAPAVIGDLHDAGFDVIDMEVVHASLEDAFVHMTGLSSTVGDGTSGEATT